MQCKQCELSFCTRCIQYEAHGCEHLVRARTHSREALEKRLSSEKTGVRHNFTGFT